MKRFTIIIVAILLNSTSVFSQKPINRLTLDEVLQLAKDQSPQAILAKHRFRASYWEYRTYKAEYLPSLTMTSTLFDFNRSLSRYKNSDGSYQYTRDNSNTSSAGLALNQNIGLTGAKIFINSSLERTDLLGSNRKTSYLSVPVSIGFSQPIFGFNSLRWEKKIEPLKYEEAKRNYLQSLETVSMDASRLFFDLILGQQNLRTAKLNHANTDTLYKIAKGRYNIGTIAENELLQMELSNLNAGSEVSDAEVDLQLKKSRIKSFLGLNDEYDLELIIPTSVPKTDVKYDDILSLAKSNNPSILALQRQLIEADQGVAQARSQRGFSASLNASYGLTQQAVVFDNAYKDPLDQQGVRVGLTIPILDWGLGKGKVKMAQSAREVTKTTVQQALTDFEQDVFLKVMQYNRQDDQVMLSAKADTISQSRYNVTKERFLIGKIDVLDLNVAQTERDAAKQKYINTLNNFWQFYYNMRKLTLYDFEKGQPLSMDFEMLLK
ncbi:MAG: TolC family protein [Bacteroidales bacterium]|nr:TolC family protein [Bacteroidales bacterium]